MWVDRNSTLTTCISGGLIWNNACVAPVYLWYFCVSMLLFPFDLKSWSLMKRTRENVLGYVWQAWSWYILQSLQMLPGQSTRLCRRLNPCSLKFRVLLNQWLKQPGTVRSRYLAVTLLHINHYGLIAHPSGRGMGVSWWVQSATEVSCWKFLVLYAIPCYCTAIYRESKVCFHG